VTQQRPPSSPLSGMKPLVLLAIGAGGLLLLMLFGGIVWMLARFTAGPSIPIDTTPVAAAPSNATPNANRTPRAPARQTPAPFILDDRVQAARERALAQIPDPTGDSAPVVPLRRIIVAIPPPVAASTGAGQAANGRAVALPTPLRLDIAPAVAAVPAAQQPAAGATAFVLDPAALAMRQRVLDQIPESTGTDAPAASLRRFVIAIPPPIAAGRAVALPAPLLLDGSTPGTAAVRPATARPATPRPATPARPPAPVSNATPTSDLDFAFHPSAHYTLATTQPVDPADKILAEALRLEKARKFVMSMTADKQGRIWIACEATQPDDGTGGVQCFDPSKPPLESFTQFTTKDGLGDNFGYAIACDTVGRIWVGHLNHGVSVYNGQKWQNYEVVGGLSNPNTLSGPLGERIFHITVNPKDGDVWIATNCGLSRYSQSKDTWTYYTRADGLPSDQANSMAFDKDGNIYVATQCDGIAMANAGDDYKTWRQVLGPDDEPTTPAGSGLPSNLMNDILVAKDGTVYAATDSGLAWSLDEGKNWQYARGANWADKVRRRPAGLPPNWVEQPGAILAEDYCTSLAQDQDGVLLVGHRSAGSERIASLSQSRKILVNADFVATILIEADNAQLYIGSYGAGIAAVAPFGRAELTQTVSVPEWPRPASPLSEVELRNLIGQIRAYPLSLDPAFIGEDWTTEGDWVGRYGTVAAILYGAGSPNDHQFFYMHSDGCRFGAEPLADGGHDALRAWIQALVTTDVRSLYDPQIGIRRMAALDDHGETYPAAHNGPGIGVLVSVPSGLHRVSLYFLNDNGHGGDTRHRDYEIDLQVQSPDGSWRSKCRARACSFWGGVFKEFALAGPAEVRIAIHKGESLNVMCSGVFVDRLDGGSVPTIQGSLPWMGSVVLGAPPLRPTSMPSYTLYSGLSDAGNAGPVASALVRIAKMQLYRAMTASKVSSGELEWVVRWQLTLWSPGNRHTFDEQMAMAWRQMQERNPILQNRQIRPYSPGNH